MINAAFALQPDESLVTPRLLTRAAVSTSFFAGDYESSVRMNASQWIFLSVFYLGHLQYGINPLKVLVQKL